MWQDRSVGQKFGRMMGLTYIARWLAARLARAALRVRNLVGGCDVSRVASMLRFDL